MTHDNNATPVLRVLELGAGMAGLAGMALAVQNPEHTRVVLTDGHPDAVLNNRVNIQLTQALMHPTMVAHLNITAQRLVWTTMTTVTTTTTKKEETLLFDLVLACDCTHFVECHAPLALTTADQLRIGGVALFLAPPRGDTLKRFVTLVQSLNGLFQVHYYDDDSVKDYSPTVSQCHDHYQQQQQDDDDETYHANIHCPHLLILRKQRPVHDSDRH
jgi:2-polyprenyl-6-methoxyphenol hydroxylase-like FAD-dependent oxidoreductase